MSPWRPGRGAPLVVHQSGGHCRLTLGGGSDYFDVTPSPGRMALADAGDTQVQVPGTAFSLRPETAGVLVTITGGRVEVNDGRAARVLTTGQQLRCLGADGTGAAFPQKPGGGYRFHAVRFRGRIIQMQEFQAAGAARRRDKIERAEFERAGSGGRTMNKPMRLHRHLRALLWIGAALAAFGAAANPEAVSARAGIIKSVEGQVTVARGDASLPAQVGMPVKISGRPRAHRVPTAGPASPSRTTPCCRLGPRASSPSTASSSTPPPTTATLDISLPTRASSP